jgi:hypothetical protein
MASNLFIWESAGITKLENGQNEILFQPIVERLATDPALVKIHHYGQLQLPIAANS